MITGEDRVLSFMDKLNEDNARIDAYNNIKNSKEYKLRMLDKCKSDAKDKCFGYILSNIYKGAVPLSADYKQAYANKMDEEFPNFIKDKIDENGLAYYIHECIKKGVPFATRINEAVNEMINDEYKDKAYDINNVDPDDLVFKMSDDNKKRLDVISKDLSTDEITDYINQSVVDTVSREIAKTKEQKEKNKELEDQLKNDPRMISTEAVNTVLAFKNAKKERVYQPHFFESIMLNKLAHINKAIKENTFEDVNTYNAISVFTENHNEEDKVFTFAFIESVKEFTSWSILKALKFENVNMHTLDKASQLYAKEATEINKSL